MQSPSIADIREWDTAQVIRYLKYPNKLDDEDLGILKANKIEAISFLSLTKEDLLADAIKRGPASLIASYVAELNGTNFCDPFAILNL